MATKTTPRHKRILHWSDERRYGNPIMVTLVKGWAYCDANIDDLACHVQGSQTVKEAMAAVRAAKPCNCNRCRGK